MMSLLLAEAENWMIMEEMTEMMKIAAQSAFEGPGIMKRLLNMQRISDRRRRSRDRSLNRP